MASGVAVENVCKETYTRLKSKHDLHYIIFKLSPNDKDPKQVIVEHAEERSSDFKAEDFPAIYKGFFQRMEAVAEAKTCCYAVIDCFWFKEGAPHPKNKIVFIYFAPESSPIKSKMVYSSTKDALLKSLGDGFNLNLQATDFEELSWKDRILKELQDKDKYN